MLEVSIRLEAIRAYGAKPEDIFILINIDESCPAWQELQDKKGRSQRDAANSESIVGQQRVNLGCQVHRLVVETKKIQQPLFQESLIQSSILSITTLAYAANSVQWASTNLTVSFERS